MDSAFVYLRPLQVAFVRAQGPYATASQEAWGKVLNWLDDTGLRGKVGVGWGLLLDHPKVVPPEKCRYDACIEIPEGYEDRVTAVFNFRRLPGGAFARQRHVGSIAGLPPVIASLRDDWAPRHGVMLDAKRPVIEIYLDDPKFVVEEKRRVDVCLPVISQAQASAA